MMTKRCAALSDQIEPPADFGSGSLDTDFILGIGKAEKRVIFLLEIGRVLSGEDAGAIGSIGAACPFCTSLQWDWQPVSGKGVIYSYQIVTQAVHPAFYDWIPYPIVLVELDEQRAVPFS